MNEINLQLVREFFELNLFHVYTPWQQVRLGVGRGEQGLQLYIENSQPAPARELGLVLNGVDIAVLHRAVVEIRAWHSDRIYASVIEANPVLTQFAADGAKQPALDFFGTPEFASVLVLSELPRSGEQRVKALTALESSPIDHIIEFPTILHELLAKVSVHGSYAGSSVLSLLQLLKRYRLVHYQQMELNLPLDLPATEEGLS